MNICSDIIYENLKPTPNRILIDGGYVTFTNNKQPVYHFYLTDHQGNVRVVVDENGTVEETNHYYPFGALFGESVDKNKQRYKYNGKELDRLLSLDWYDYGARWYAPVLARWHAVDPLADKYPDVSPYVYCNNNAVNAVDPDGRKIVNVNGNVVVSILNGKIQFSEFANDDIKRIVNNMSITKTGFTQLYKLINSSTKIQIKLSEANKLEGKSIIYGETIQGNYNVKDNYGRYFERGKYKLKTAKITIYIGSIREAIKEGSGLKYEGLTEDEALGSVMSHEAVHSTDVNEIDADIKYEIKNKGKARPNREKETNKIEEQIMEELKWK
ncbi:RHS repeat-associated core domain-containing protein [Prevotella sp. PCHR]|uniref:RHS repeat-associated core domain-containing protein n=2 Tax=Xylanibacter caecicola TaxID=2736294 RepID=A0ABX2B2H3_9BACT|nr:RHS repeat-associated core domain-containing protein [Xylanibacter caecicola]NPE25468.1 RHS repeat-associated core domain-containing protein [Xylanibacter caecicola]